MVHGASHLPWRQRVLQSPSKEVISGHERLIWLNFKLLQMVDFAL